MAINAQKFLPASKSYGIVKSGSSLVPKSGGALLRIEKKVIAIDKLVKSNLVLYKKTNALARREDENKALEAKEKELEKQKPKPVKGMKMPKLPGFGFIGWIKNWIFNTILGFITVRLIEHLPKMIKFASVVGPVMEGILDFSGVLLNGMISFIDAGYKAVDATRGLVGKSFGEDGIKNFDMLSKKLTEFMNIAIVVGMASSDIGMGGLGKKGAKKAAGTLGRRGAGRVATRMGARVGGKAGAKLGTKIGSKVLKAIPFVSTAIAVVEGAMRLQEGDSAGALLSFGTAIPVLGWGFLGADILRETGVFKFAGGGYVRPRRYAGGGYTSPRSLSKTKTRQVAATAQKPKPGASVGGEKNIKSIFPRAPKGKETSIANPLGYLEGASKTFTSDKDLGAVFNLPIKTLMGDKPSPLDYRNAGVALSNFVSNYAMGVGGFAKGGEVERRALATGRDMSDVIAKTIETSVSSEVDKVINDLMKQLNLKKEGEGTGEKPTSEEQVPEGTGSLVGNTNAEKVFNFLLGAGFTEQAAAGVIGNLMQESGVNPQSRQLGGGPGRGIMQWGTGPGSGGRWDALVAWASSSGKDPWKLDTQVEWMMKEMRSYGTYNRLKGVTDIKKAVEIFEKEMEKAGTPNYPRRYQFAADALVSFGKQKGGAGGFNIELGKGYGSEGSKIAGELGRYVKRLGVVPGSIHEHPEHGGVKGRHSPNSYHYQGRAIDLGAYANEQGPILKAIASFSKLKGVKPVELLHAGNEPSGHSDHVHVAFAKGGRIVKPMMALMGEKGQEFVFDADTTRGMDTMAPGLLEQLNAAKTKPQLAGILKTYVDDEPEVILVPIPIPSTQGSMGGGGGSAPIVSVNSKDNSWMFDRLATGTG